MKGTPRLVRLVTTIALPLAGAVSGCATAARAPATGGPAPQEISDRGPRVRVWTTDEFSSFSRVRPVIRLEEDAYVIVVNVGLDGYANVIFPESPDDDGFMRGGRTYRLSSFFPGFANHFYRSRYGRLHNAVSAYDDVYDRYAGYVFVIASRRPMHFQVTEALGFWDDYRLAAHEQQLEPHTVIQEYAQRLVSGRTDYTARFARYAAFAGSFAHRGSLASCALYGPVLGYFPSWIFNTVGSWWTPFYGFGYGGAGSRCGYGFGLAFNTARPIRGPFVTPPVTPTPGTPKPVTRPPQVDPGDPDERDDGKDRNARPKTRRERERVREREADEEQVVDVNRDTRAAQRREEGPRRAINHGRGGRGWDGATAGERYDGVRRTDTRTPVDHDSRAGGGRARSESSHGERARSEPRASEPRASEPRTSEPRRDPPPRAAPERSEPRSEPRPAPAPRAEPARSDPRGERQPKPARR